MYIFWYLIELGAQPSLSIFAQKYLCRWEDTYFILQNKYLPIIEDSFLYLKDFMYNV